MTRFTLRDLLWLTLAVALILGWLSDRIQVARERSDDQRQITLLLNNGAIWQLKAKLLADATRKAGWTVDLEGPVTGWRIEPPTSADD
jgi:hypothetical protein